MIPVHNEFNYFQLKPITYQMRTGANGIYISPQAGGQTTSTPSLSRLILTPFHMQQVDGRYLVAEMAIATTVAGGVGALGRFGIYHSNQFGRPGKLMFDAGTFSTEGALGPKQHVVNRPLWSPYETVYIAYVSQVLTCTVRVGNITEFIPSQASLAAALAITNTTAYFLNGVTGALPADLTTLVGDGDIISNPPLVAIRLESRAI